MAKQPGAWLADLTWRDAGDRLAGGWPVVLPIGAGAKAHGPHLPLGVDRIVVEALAGRIAARLPVLIAPTTTIGYYPAFLEFPASQHISADLFQALLEAQLRRFVAAGATRLLLLNNGVSTEGPALTACHTIYGETGARPAVAHLRLYGRAADGVLDDPTGGHADERETSVMLALRPDLVDLTRLGGPPMESSGTTAAARPGSGRLARPVRLAVGRAPGPGEASDAGATGDPAKATPAKGQAILQAVADELVADVRQAFPDAPGMAEAGA